MNVTLLTKAIKDYALEKTKVDKIGIAPVERFNGTPEGFHPTDFLPGCRSVIVCAVIPPCRCGYQTESLHRSRVRAAKGIWRI